MAFVALPEFDDARCPRSGQIRVDTASAEGIGAPGATLENDGPLEP